MKTKYLALIALTIFALALTACKDEPNNPPPPKPIEVTFNIPAECANLNKTKPITIIFPGTFTDTARQNNIKAKFVNSMADFDWRAGWDSGFKNKINAILDRGLVVNIEETSSPIYGIKVVENKLVVDLAWIEHPGVNGGNIYTRITSFIDDDVL